VGPTKNQKRKRKRKEKSSKRYSLSWYLEVELASLLLFASPFLLI